MALAAWDPLEEVSWDPFTPLYFSQIHSASTMTNGQIHFADSKHQEGIVDEDHPEEDEEIDEPYDVERVLEVKDTQEVSVSWYFYDTKIK